jgi:cyclic beta-1,2-glucan synthetase
LDPAVNDQLMLENQSTTAPSPDSDKEPGEHKSGHPNMEELAQELAHSQKLLSETVKHIPLTRFLSKYGQVFERSAAYFNSLSEPEKPIPVAAEWVLDNGYLVQQNLRQMEEDLPLDFYRQLPALQDDGLPRAYHIARVIIQVDHARVDPARVRRFVDSYQTVMPLEIGELWALPSMLRLRLMEILVVTLLRIAEQKQIKLPENISIRLPSELTDSEAVANCIISMRTLTSYDWKEFFEDVSLVEQHLGQDPSGIYRNMDFETRDRYRKVVEEIARSAKLGEWEVAQSAVRFAQEALMQASTSQQSDELSEQAVVWSEDYRRIPHRWSGDQFPSTAHVGYYLIGRGRPALERRLGAQLRAGQRIMRHVKSHATPYYLGAILLLTILLQGMVLIYARDSGSSLWMLLMVMLIVLIPSSTLAVNLINHIITNFLRPNVLPKMDFSEGIPETHSSLVVIPALISSIEEADSLLRQLEMHYLRNRSEHLYFGLLTDYTDCTTQHDPADKGLLEHLESGIKILNDRYNQKVSAFFLFHRDRRWNPGEKIWMGWERKRGKLNELNQLILGQGDGSFCVKLGALDVLPQIRYVITLDADTILPINSAHRLVATMAHPLNQAEFDPRTGRIISGYTILQPRVEINPSRENWSLFTRIFTADTGLDLYTLAVSDVYQDLFGEGIYVGKGIYDVAAFERSLQGRIPENALLSHDLFEGIQGRSALVTDIVLIEDYPPHYFIQVHRSHRWVRGDWQLLPWLLPRVPSADGGNQPNHLKAIDRWKILDNLRRSLLPPSLLALLVAGWTFLPGLPAVWTLAAILVLSVPTLDALFSGFLKLSSGERFDRWLAATWQPFLRWMIALVFIPYETLVNLDAIVTTLARLFIRRGNLLQWTTSAQSLKRYGEQISQQVTWQQMTASFLLVSIVSLGLTQLNPESLWAAMPLLVLWLFSPIIAYKISKPIQIEKILLSSDQNRSLRSLARATWFFFERFVGPEDHWLPPDNYQEEPLGMIAHRTSPTNIGMLLLATLGAYDFGYIGVYEMVARLRETFDTMSGLDRYRGHFINWYDTVSLNPLNPRYISTVDSGNLAACLMALGQGCLAVFDMPLLRREFWSGLDDTLSMLVEWIDQLDLKNANEDAAALKVFLTDFQRYILEVEENPQDWYSALQSLTANIIEKKPVGSDKSMQALDNRLIGFVEIHAKEIGTENLRRLRLYINSIHSHLERGIRTIQIFKPWLSEIENIPQLFSEDEGDEKLIQLWQELCEVLLFNPRFSEVDRLSDRALNSLQQLDRLLERNARDHQLLVEARQWCRSMIHQIEEARMSARSLENDLQRIFELCEKYVHEMDFTFLYDPRQKVFHIGYSIELNKLDNNYYDLLASEARIASLIAIAKGNVPLEHWLHLSRPITSVNKTRMLLSWSGTMFEYLLPDLLIKSYEGTLLHQSMRAVVNYQIHYGRSKNVPWGCSESGFYRFDNNMYYQYRAFGVPGAGYKRGLGDDLVITPYASLLALSLKPDQVVENLERLRKYNALGMYGLYEAIDFTEDRLPAGKEYALVKSYMAHHQGMIFISLLNHFTESIMVRRFHANPYIQSVELLLQEEIPFHAPLEFPLEEQTHLYHPVKDQEVISSWRMSPNPPEPKLHALSNGRYSVLITSSGGGFSRWQNVDLTRWHPDTTYDDWGTWIYVQDLDRPDQPAWSATFKPTARRPNSHDVAFNAHMVEFRCRNGDISLFMDVTVPPEDDLEIRLLTVTNQSDHQRSLRLTSYAEIILTPQANDERHPAFNKLFIESRFFPENNMLLFRRRPQKSDEKTVFLAHALVPGSNAEGALSHLSDRGQFIGRGGTRRSPRALMNSASGYLKSAKSMIDPIASLSYETALAPHDSVQLAFITLAGSSTESIETLVKRYSRWDTITRAYELAYTQAEKELYQLGLTSLELASIQRLLSVLFYPHRSLRAAPQTLAANRSGQSVLWAQGISGDYPILLVCIQEAENLSLLQLLLRAHAYWRSRRIRIDLVILNQQASDYNQELADQIRRLIISSDSEDWLNQRGGIFVVNADHLRPEETILLQTAARAILDASSGALSEQVERLEILRTRLPLLMTTPRPARKAQFTPPVARPSDLLFDNNLGGASPYGREYVIYLTEGQWTPMPWINVIANPEFGFSVSEAGSGCTWAINSSENRLTPWSNDPVIDPPGEVLYLRDEETTLVWTVTPGPAHDPAPYLVRHGMGYSIFEHNSQGLKQEMSIFAVPDAPVKIIKLRLENVWDRPRRITATYYAEWVLGVNRSLTQQYVIPEYDGDSQALLARNPFNTEFGERVAFLAGSKTLHGLTADRTEFIGRRGSYRQPIALRRIGLTGTVEPGIDPCAAVQIHLDLTPGGSEEIYFLLGQGKDRQQALQLVKQYQNPEEVKRAWQAVRESWDNILTAVQVKTPDPALDFLLNHWLLYQALSSRIWGRSAFYQPGGGYGFRDQLQDVMALVHAAPELARQHILLAAQHQFEEGDVLHWWHPPSGRGVRTRYSDDLIWLPFVVSHYIEAVGDLSILDEMIPFKQGEPLNEDQVEHYSYFADTKERYSLYEHCRRALSRGSTRGPHNLPLMGSGDWNDGMNRVGIEGRGESVWLGWFLSTTLDRFADICDSRGDHELAEDYRQQAIQLIQSIEENAWDGNWYLRAFYDDGTPLGSAQNTECQIDSITQSWAVLSRKGNPERIRRSMQAVSEHLIKEQDGLILLFTPPFKDTSRDPGYIKGYLPGIRENGGQYTHAAIWVVWAYTMLDQGDYAYELFRMLNPLHHADDIEKAQKYMVEPYVVAADVYSREPYIGRGGWTWYTGSSSWMYRLGIEAILGIRRIGSSLSFNPCIPRNWESYQIDYRYGSARYHIEVQNPENVNSFIRQIILDGDQLDGVNIPLHDDGEQHEVIVILGK